MQFLESKFDEEDDERMPQAYSLEERYSRKTTDMKYAW